MFGIDLGGILGPVGGVIGGVLGGGPLGGMGSALGWMGAGREADASQNISLARQRQAELERGFAIGTAAPTADEMLAMKQQLDQYNMALDQQKTFIERQSKILAQANPTIEAAFKGIQDIMAGKTSQFTEPLMKQIEIGRQRTENALLAQMGGGAQTSSAGMQANALFGQQAAMALAQGQMQAANLYGSAIGTAQNAVTGAQSNVANAFNMGQMSSRGLFDMSNAVQSRQLQAALGSKVSEYQGGQYVKDLMMGSYMRQQGEGMQTQGFAQTNKLLDIFGRGAGGGMG